MAQKKILIACSECFPFAKTGGLADVVGTLARYLPALGYDARLIMPCHRNIKQNYCGRLEHMFSFSVRLGWRTQYVGIEKLCENGTVYYFVDNEFYFGSDIYCGGEFEGEQYAFFCRAVLEALPIIDFIPDILHLNDWHTAMMAMLIKTHYPSSPVGRITTVLTIHNIAYQGKFSFDFIHDILGIDSRFYSPEFIENYGCASFLKAGCVFADRLTTVSPSYALEICLPEYGEGLDGILSARRSQLCGILNGIDGAAFDPSNDPLIPYHFSEHDLSGKTKAKKALFEELGLTYNPDRPLICSVGRLVEQKGIDLLVQIMDGIIELGAAVAVVGSGQSEYENMMHAAQARHPGRISVYTGYDEALSHRVYAASDFLIMPSRFEPCGLAQMIAMRYGTLPIVRETGGLRDSVTPFNRYTGEGNGFSFANFDPSDMYFTVERAVRTYHDKYAMAGLINCAMRADFSFPRCAAEYGALYEDILR